MRKLSRRVRLAVALVVGVAATVLLLRKPQQAAFSGRGGFSSPPSAEALEDGFEVKDLSARGLGVILAVMGVSAASLIGVVFLMIWLFAGWNREQGNGLTSVQLTTIATPGPLLQTDPVADLARQRAREQALLNGYAWTDASHTRARVPIARAMALVAGHSLDEAP